MSNNNSITKQEQKAIEGRRLYQKEWRAKNKDRVKQYNLRYFEKYAEQHKENAQNVQNK